VTTGWIGDILDVRHSPFVIAVTGIRDEDASKVIELAESFRKSGENNVK